MKKLGMMALIFAGLTAHAKAEPAAIHGMLLFGKNANYASHLPMYHAPHDKQVLLKIGLKDLPGSDTLKRYETVRDHSAENFTLVPEALQLTAIISGQLANFTAEIFHGHFERGGKSLGAVQVAVQKVIFSAQLQEHETKNDNKYLVFGAKGEYFALHVIGGKPNFDALIKVSAPTNQLPGGFCRTRLCDEPKVRPVPDHRLPIVVSTGLPGIPESKDHLFNHLGDSVAVQKVLYSEEGDLQ